MGGFKTGRGRVLGNPAFSFCAIHHYRLKCHMTGEQARIKTSGSNAFLTRQKIILSFMVLLFRVNILSFIGCLLSKLNGVCRAMVVTTETHCTMMEPNWTTICQTNISKRARAFTYFATDTFLVSVKSLIVNEESLKEWLNNASFCPRHRALNDIVFTTNFLKHLFIDVL